MPSSTAWQEVLLSNFGFSWKPSVMLLSWQPWPSVVRFLLPLQWTGVVGEGMKWRSDFGRRWQSPQKVFKSQKHFCCGEKKGHLSLEQATGDSRGGTRPSLLTCGFNYPVSHWFTVIQV